jgi:hypothetical protein
MQAAPGATLQAGQQCRRSFAPRTHQGSTRVAQLHGATRPLQTRPRVVQLRAQQYDGDNPELPRGPGAQGVYRMWKEQQPVGAEHGEVSPVGVLLQLVPAGYCMHAHKHQQTPMAEGDPHLAAVGCLECRAWFTAEGGFAQGGHVAGRSGWDADGQRPGSSRSVLDPCSNKQRQMRSLAVLLECNSCWGPG